VLCGKRHIRSLYELRMSGGQPAACLANSIPPLASARRVFSADLA
jgi:hypothetical protein